jgi:hypothetical protein
MKQRSIRKSLSKQRQELLEDTTRLLAEGQLDHKEATQRINRLRVVDELYKAYGQRHAFRGFLPVLAGLTCLALVTILWMIPVSAIPFSLTVHATDVEMSLPGEVEIADFIEAKQVRVTGAQSVTFIAAGVNENSAADPLTIAAQGEKVALKNVSAVDVDRVTITLKDDTFGMLFREKGRISGEIEILSGKIFIENRNGRVEHDLRAAPDLPEDILFLAKSQQQKNVHKQRQIPLLTDISVVLPSRPFQINSLKPATVSFSRQKHHEDFEAKPDFESSITGGSLKIRQTGAILPLHSRDELHLKGLNISYSSIMIDNGIQMTLEGIARRIATGPAGHAQNRNPSWLEYLYHNHQLGFFWSAVTFAWTMLWAIKNTVFK